MGSIVGFVAFTLISYVLIVLNVPFLIIPFTVLGVVFAYRSLVGTVRQIKFRWNAQTWLILAVFVIGILGQLAVISPSGVFQNGNLVFWSAHGHDGVWHIALMEEFKKGYPFQDPSFAGEKLVNYHFFSDIAPAMVSKYLPISDLDLYFRIFPLIYSIFLGASAFYLTRKITNNISASVWATVFTYFAGSFGFIVTYLKNKTIGGESIFWATQPQSSSGNPPQIVSNFLLLTSLYFLITYLQKKKSKLMFSICVLLIGTISAFKIYAGVVLLGALGIAGLWQLIRDHDFGLLLITFFSGILAALLYFPNSSGSTSFLIFQPWWYIRTMVVEPSRLNLIDWELRRQTYISVGRITSYLRVIQLEVTAFLIFFFGNLGMRFLGLWDMVKMSKNSLKNYFNLMFVLIIVISLILPLLFLQKGVASNTGQFLQYFVLLFGILAGITTAQMLSNAKTLTRVIVTVLMILAIIPTQAGLLNEFYGPPNHPRTPFAQITKQELAALKFVKENTPIDSVIVTPPYNQYLNLGDSIPNIWDWFDTSYIAALSARRTYMDDYEQADIMGYDYKPKLEIKKIIFESDNSTEVKAALAKTNANLVYFPLSEKPKVDLNKIGLSMIFQNQSVEIWDTKIHNNY